MHSFDTEAIRRYESLSVLDGEARLSMWRLFSADEKAELSRRRREYYHCGIRDGWLTVLHVIDNEMCPCCLAKAILSHQSRLPPCLNDLGFS